MGRYVTIRNAAAICGAFSLLICSVASARSSEPFGAPTTEYAAKAAENIVSDRVTERMDRLAFADRIYAYSRDTRDPHGFIVAAGIYQELGGIVDADSSGKIGTIFPDDFREEARRIIGEDRTLQSELEIRTSRTTKWLIGARPIDLRLLPEAGPSKALNYKGGQPAVVQLRPASGEVRIAIRDANDRIICRTIWTERSAYCRWIPKRDGVFRIYAERKSGAGPIRVAAS